MSTSILMLLMTFFSFLVDRTWSTKTQEEFAGEITSICRLLTDKNNKFAISILQKNRVPNTDFYTTYVGYYENLQDQATSSSGTILWKLPLEQSAIDKINTEAKFQTNPHVLHIAHCEIDSYTSPEAYTLYLGFDGFKFFYDPTARAQFCQDVGGNMMKCVIKLLKAVKAFNDSGYYHNKINSGNLVVDSAGNLKLWGMEYANPKNPTGPTTVPKATGSDFDPPSTFTVGARQSDTDDLYSAALTFIMSASNHNIDYYAKGQEGFQAQCRSQRQMNCQDFIADRALTDMPQEWGNVIPRFWDKLTARILFDWANGGWKTTLADLNMKTLIDGLLRQYKFKPNAAQFIELLDWVATKRII